MPCSFRFVIVLPAIGHVPIVKHAFRWGALEHVQPFFTFPQEIIRPCSIPRKQVSFIGKDSLLLQNKSLHNKQRPSWIVKISAFWFGLFVVQELPRFLKAFPQAKAIALHGSSKEKGQEAQIPLSTTHQAIRFYEKFDFIVIDEVDVG